MFDPPSQRYPKKWKERSLDYRMMFIYHGSMMVLFVAGQALSVRQEAALTALLVAALVTISFRQRKSLHWRLPPVRARNVIGASFTTVAIAFFLFSATPLFPPSDHRVFPWYLAGLGMGMFAILTSLGVVNLSEADFLLNCRTIDEYGREIDHTSVLPPIDIDPGWKKFARGTYSVIFVLVWFCGVASFFFFGNAVRHGSPVPTATQSEPVEDHGRTGFVTRDEKRRIEWLQRPPELESRL